MAGKYLEGSIVIVQRNSTGNIIRDNYVSYDQGLQFDFNAVKLSNGPQTAQEEIGALGIEDCHGNFIAYNIMLITRSSGCGGSIIGYEPFLIIPILGAVIFIILRKKQIFRT